MQSLALAAALRPSHTARLRRRSVQVVPLVQPRDAPVAAAPYRRLVHAAALGVERIGAHTVREEDEQARLEEEEARRRLRLVTERVEAKLNVQSDPERIMAGTAASTAPKASEFDMYPVRGYTDQTLMRDMRFRITEALSRAGLNQTQHARQTVAALANKAAANGGYHRAGLNTTIKLG